MVIYLFKMNVICAIAKNEHKYINDWVKWHIDIGFDFIYLFDNDDIATKDIYWCIEEKYRNKVQMINVRGWKELHLQQHLYNDFYNKFKSNFDWCMFIDIDEYLFGVDNVKEWLNNIPKEYNQIRIKWKLFGDDELITRDMSKPIYEVFKTRIKHSLHRNLQQKGNLESQGKSIVRGHLDSVIITSPHFASYKTRDNVLKSCLPSGKDCRYSKVVIHEVYDKETIWLHHYMTKSLSEFVEQKLNRNDCVYNDNIKMNYYWRINKITPQKILYLREKGIR